MEKFDIVIETPKGHTEKYSWDKRTGLFKLNKILPAGMMFPFDFGLIPQTKGDDGEPLDAIVISEFRTFPGCMLECRLIGAILAEQSEKNEMIRNDRFFFIPTLSVVFGDIKQMKDLPLKEKNEIEDFFINYNKAEGKDFRILKTVEPKKAIELIEVSSYKIGDEAVF